MFICQFCNRMGNTTNSHKNHELRCAKNPNRIIPVGNKGLRLPWNKGMTIKTHPKLAKKLKAGGVAFANKLKTTGTKPFWATAEYWTPERRKEKSEWRKQLHQEHPETHPNRKLAYNKTKMSYPEKVAYETLEKMGVQFEHNKNIGKYWVDFCIGEVIIEIDGKRWHDKFRDEVRDAELISFGYTVFRIDTKEHIENRIRSILE